MTSSFLVLAGLWIGFGALHSLLASVRFKRWVESWLGAGYRWYRLLYSIQSTALAFAIFLYGATLPNQTLWPHNSMIRFLGMIFAAYGFLVVRLAFKGYSTRQFLGLSGTTDDETLPLVVDGAQRYVRHPLYSGTFLLLIGFLLFSPTLANAIMVGALILYTLIGIRWEEQKLIQRFGDAYREYQKEVPALIPREWPRFGAKE